MKKLNIKITPKKSFSESLAKAISNQEKKLSEENQKIASSPNIEK